ncbi:hypothetical protein CXF93_17520 [Moritella sp. Urea-trap-13]|nr:hypothetical protein CXF93_17520 [Moritella sp. Urea-trap-13]
MRSRVRASCTAPIFPLIISSCITFFTISPYYLHYYKIQNPKSKIQNPKSKIQNPKSKIQNFIATNFYPMSFRPISLIY